MSTPDLDDFRRHACGYWESVDAGDVRAANARSDAAEVVANGWPEPDRTKALADLMNDEDTRVRYAAAACAGPSNEEAESTLAALAGESTGLVAPTAKLLLSQWQAGR